MFGLNSKNKRKAIHEIIKYDWESMLDKVYYRVVARHSLALCIISNTKRENVEDNEGTYSEEVTYRFKKKISPKVFVSIKQINKEVFGNLFKIYLDLDENKKFDFCHINKKHGVNTDYMIYPLFKGLDKKAMILFDFHMGTIEGNHVCEDLLRLFTNRKRIDNAKKSQ